MNQMMNDFNPDMSWIFLKKKIQLFIGLFFLMADGQMIWAQIPAEQDGFVRVEAEAFDSQELDSKRKWYRIGSDHADPAPDHLSPVELSTSSGRNYLQVLPDTRITHDDPLVAGENFSNHPGKLAVLSYSIQINNPGRYYVWVRAFSTGTEDNGIHVGIDGTWPESGQRMQWCEGKNLWTWASKQRTSTEHCGVERLIYLDINKPGRHTISFSMREDGFKFDTWALTRLYKMPE